MQFTYTFPPIMRFGYDVITDAMAADQPYVQGNGLQSRVDTWRQWSRWKRVCFILTVDKFLLAYIFCSLKQGLFGGRWYFKLFNLIIFLGGLVTACLGSLLAPFLTISLNAISRYVGFWRIYQSSFPEPWSCHLIWLQVAGVRKMSNGCQVLLKIKRLSCLA